MKKLLFFFVAALSATMMYAGPKEAPVDPFSMSFGEVIDDWYPGDFATLNEDESDVDFNKYVYDIKGGEPNDAFLNEVPDVIFRTKNSSDKAKAFIIYPGHCFQYGGKNGVLIIRNTDLGDVITLEVAAKGSTAANFLDEAETYPINAVALTEDLTLPAKDVDAEDADENGYIWRTLQYESLGGDVEIKEFKGGYRVRAIKVTRGSEPAVIEATCAEAAAAMPEEENAMTEDIYVVTGFVTATIGEISPSFTDSTIMQQRFWMDDEQGSAKTLQAYWCNLPGDEALNVGDKITLTGRILNYKGTPEIKNGDIEILERYVAPVVDTINITVSTALEIGAQLGDNEVSETVYTIMGYVSAIDVEFSEQYRNQSFWITDWENSEAASNEEGAFYVYRGKPETDKAIPVGALVEFTSPIKKYINRDSVAVIENSEMNVIVRILELPVDTTVIPEAQAISIAEALEIGEELEENTATEEEYILQGFVSAIDVEFSEQYRNESFWLAETPGTTAASNAEGAFYVYRGKPENDEAIPVDAEVRLTTSIKKYVNKNGEVVIENRDANVVVEILHLPEVPPVPEFIYASCAEAAAAMPAESGAETEYTYVVTGYVTATIGEISPSRTDASIMQQRFWMDDEPGETQTLQAYWCNLPGDEALNVGDKIILTGKILNYNGTPEIKNGDVEILERAIIDTTEVGNVISVAKAIELTMALDSAATSEDVFVVEGYVINAQSFDQVYNNQIWFMADDPENSNGQLFQAYLCLPTLENGEIVRVLDGDKVRLEGKLTKYYERAKERFVPEIKNGLASFVEMTEGDHSVHTEVLAITPGRALEIAEGLEPGQMTEEYYEVIGVVTAITGKETDFETYGNETYWIADEINPTATSNAEGAFYVYRGVAEKPVQVGMVVSVYTRIYKYQGAGDPVVECTQKSPVTILREPGETVYPVFFLDWNGDLLSEQEVVSFGAAVEPEVPIRGGYVFTGWSKPFDRITDRLFVVAQYEPERPMGDHVVNFIDGVDGSLIDSTTIVLDVPAPFVHEGLNFVGWEIIGGSLENDITIQAVYVDPSQGLENNEVNDGAARKIVRDGNLFILNANKTYTATGTQVK